MLRYREAFANRHVVLPVIHVETADQSIRNAEIAQRAGADGVFLISHSLGYKGLFEIYRQVRSQFQNHLWIGVNCLDLLPEEVFDKLPSDVDGVWVDNACIDELSDSQPKAERICAMRESSGWRGFYFGGVAFKYQRHVSDLYASARIASQYMDVVTTSGSGTGEAANREKIAAMKKALDWRPLAIASGITPENVSNYLDIAEFFLVATGISRSFTEFDPSAVKALIERVRAYASDR